MMKDSFVKIFILFSYGFSLSLSANAQKHAVRYSLFHPVPASQLRDMETDRPDVTESPFTVNAGHFQYETDLFRIVREKSDMSKTSTLLINQANLKIGLTESTALQVGFQSYGEMRQKDLASGKKTHTHGIGDLTVRVKQNLFGNNGGNFALALLPYVKFPTSEYDSEGRFEYGLILPMQFKLPGEWKLGLQLETDRLKDQDQQAMHTELLQSVTVAHALVKKLDGIAETYYTYDFKAQQWSNFLNAALQLELAKNVKLDAGFNYGIQHQAARHYFLGAACRF
ncbi:transporter [Pedobacter heparinus]|uniref:Transporter n=1 Tax=Pedobacter heparinus (strain ATCC 13125 / DSM 2366 / CIP 104194 / JCM 7457 / NBRC 12017 / NCIMB 9290 / NRRL B-14731 / HIM 762-3) TaxID=485917 RepID=C6XV84_PEDHD|nr:transporter [Pedobacter heparinus]ACU03950.1 conserved hypothetical protein [Pedobacter heparinus DSM 2366]